ncbi:unnamed protein product [Trichogramma brassicae]|uniref:Uncharacterized protein n=1 Tax=Trichogramma brassicae TaxID=86971 RepID=A0A6H5J1V2_9HYME|nr:unnamed protein product [Trichogramma brassicae]
MFTNKREEGNEGGRPFRRPSAGRSQVRRVWYIFCSKELLEETRRCSSFKTLIIYTSRGSRNGVQEQFEPRNGASREYIQKRFSIDMRRSVREKYDVFFYLSCFVTGTERRASSRPPSMTRTSTCTSRTAMRSSPPTECERCTSSARCCASATTPFCRTTSPSTCGPSAATPTGPRCRSISCWRASIRPPRRPDGTTRCPGGPYPRTTRASSATT